MNEKTVKQEKELSAARDTFASTLFNEGARMEKECVLNALPEEFARLHRSGAFHIHDLDGWNLVNNCSTPLPEYVWHPERLRTKTPGGRIAELFEQFKEMICTVQHRQSGGVGSCNFDREMAEALVAADVEPTVENATVFGEQATLLFTWLSTQRLRYARENFYVTLNMGLDTSAWGRIVTHESIAAFDALPVDYTRPNLVFKVKGEINGRAGSPNYDLFLEACDCTTRKMIPTYLLMDAEPNRACDPFKINIMGCRTRVYANRNGGAGSVGRGNIAALSLNLPRIALETKEWEKFFKLLKARMNAAKRVLLLRAEAIRKSPFAAEMAESGVWSAKDVDEMCRQGTYSIGFIGLAETVEILGGGKMQSDPRARELARRILEVMRETTDGYANETGLNFSLLASAGEGISGRFPKMDAELFPDAECWKKGFTPTRFMSRLILGWAFSKSWRMRARFIVLRMAEASRMSNCVKRRSAIRNVWQTLSLTQRRRACPTLASTIRSTSAMRAVRAAPSMLVRTAARRMSNASAASAAILRRWMSFLSARRPRREIAWPIRETIENER